MNGLHIISNFYNCDFDFSNEQSVMDAVAKFCTDAGLTVVGVKQFNFEPQGITFTVLLAESHVSFHSWPEEGNVALDIYTCNYFNSNNDKTKNVYNSIKALLKPQRDETIYLDRSSLRTIQEDTVCIS